MDKREYFENALKRILAIQLPKSQHDNQTIHILFNDEKLLKQAIFFIQDYKTIGFSLIIEKINDHEAIIKLHDIESDDLYTCNKVVIQTGLIDDYKKRITNNTKLSFGVLTKIENQIQIDYTNRHQVNLKSVIIRDHKI